MTPSRIVRILVCQLSQVNPISQNPVYEDMDDCDILWRSYFQYDAYYDEYQQRAQHISMQRQALDAFQATLELFQDQVKSLTVLTLSEIKLLTFFGLSLI